MSDVRSTTATTTATNSCPIPSESIVSKDYIFGSEISLHWDRVKDEELFQTTPFVAIGKDVPDP